MNVGVIGTNWGRMHIGAFRTAGANVTAVCGRDREKTQRVAAEERIAFATTSVEELVARVDAVVVASADAAHGEHVRAALSAGKPVLCEKPLAMSGADAESLVAAADAAGVAAAVGFPYRMLPEVQGLERFLRASSPVSSLELIFRNGFITGPTTGSGDFGGMSHVIDTALFLVGRRVTRVKALLDSPHAQSVHLLMEFEGGARAALSHRPTVEPGTWGSWALRGADWEAGFSAGYRPAERSWIVETPRAFRDGRWREVALSRSSAGGGSEPWARAHAETARAFMRVVRGEAWPRELATLADGAAVQRIVDGARDNSAGEERISFG